jgi:methylaspartate ammonia-lyase
MKIVDVICSKGMTGFFFDDQRSIKSNAIPDGGTYKGEAVTKGFNSPRQAGESISVMLVLEDGQIAYGDCAAVQYSGAAGRDPLFLANEFIPVIENQIRQILVGRELDKFKILAEEIDSLVNTDTGERMHTAIRYGVTQAILDGVSKSKKILMADVIATEYGTKIADKEIPIFTQSGDFRRENADKMIVKNAHVLPHGLFNNAKTKVGKNGELLLEYVRWLRNRITELRNDGEYNPVIHIDVYGTLGVIFENNLDRIVEYLRDLERVAYPLKLRVEGPVEIDEREGQI